jgi:DNA-binding response OmpR family regulator
MLCERCQTRLEPEKPEINSAVFDRERHSVIVEQQFRTVGTVPWEALELLWRHRTRIVRHRELYDWLYGEKLEPPFDNVVKVHILQLRRALAGSPYRIKTVYGEGYRLESAMAVDPVPVRELSGGPVLPAPYTLQPAALARGKGRGIGAR